MAKVLQNCRFFFFFGKYDMGSKVHGSYSLLVHIEILEQVRILKVLPQIWGSLESLVYTLLFWFSRIETPVIEFVLIERLSMWNGWIIITLRVLQCCFDFRKSWACPALYSLTNSSRIIGVCLVMYWTHMLTQMSWMRNYTGFCFGISYSGFTWSIVRFLTN